jgi:hypothetical protein
MSRDLAPPVVMRHLERTKDPLPAIGSTPNRHATTTTTALHESTSADTPKSSETSPKSLSDSPTMVGSLALARRRHRSSPEQPHEARSPSPADDAATALIEDHQNSARRSHHHHHHHHHHQLAAGVVGEVLEAETNAAPLIAHRPEGTSPGGGVSPVSRHHGKLEPLNPSALSHAAAGIKTQQISPSHPKS